MIPRQAARHRPAGKGLGAGLLLVLLISAMAPGSNRAWGHTKGMYSTRAAAEKRAAELRCQGAYPMGDLWMPCANEQRLHKALRHQQQ